MITFKSGSTNQSIEFVKENLKYLGKISKVMHVRDKQAISYVTTIYGENDTMEVTGGLGSGYSGEGPSGLVKILKYLGVAEDEAKIYVYENTEEEHMFKVNL